MTSAGRRAARSGRMASCASCAFLALVWYWRGACGTYSRAEIRLDHAAHRADRFAGDLHAVGSHIGDEADGFAADVDAFVEPLRDAHGVGRRKTKLAARFLLQGRGGERRLRMSLDRLCLDRVDGEGRTFRAPRLKASASSPEPMSRRCSFLPSAPTSRASKVSWRGVASVATSDQYSRRTNFSISSFAVADQPQRHRLHAAGRTRARQLAPQHRRQREADQVIERAARQIGIDQRLVDGARMRHRLGHRLLGDGVEHHALDRSGR